MSHRFPIPSALLPLLLVACAAAQEPPVPSVPAPAQLDPTRNLDHPVLFSSFHQPLPEQYIWTKNPEHMSRERRDQPRYFRAHFHVDDPSTPAMLYLAGPRGAEVYVNGRPAAHLEADPLSRMEMVVLCAELTKFQHAGDNVLAIAADHGTRMVAKILPASPGVIAPPILISDGSWKVNTNAADGWQNATFDDGSWAAVDAMGSIEGNIDFFQWNRDAGLYDWPGYEGASPFLAHADLPAQQVRDVYAADGSFENVDALTTTSEDPAHPFSVHFAPRPFSEAAPSITLDFGREVTGRIQIVSATDSPITVSVAYGESVEEAHAEPYLGVDVIHDTPKGTAVGPKSAFRYAEIRFLSGPPVVMFKAIRVEDIYYPVRYQGSFESSDPLLNQIWATGAYTSHLCMQDDIWDAPKRDRGRWMGDTDVSGRVIDDVFADHFLLEDTLTRLIGPLPIRSHVNGIPGYSSFWFTELKHYYLHSGRKEYVASMHDEIVGLLQFMDKDFDADSNFINHTHQWLYVDWALELNGDTPQTRIATTLEYIRAYRAGAWLLRQMGDSANAEHFEQRADALAQHSQTAYATDGVYGPRWQTNAMAVISGTAQPDQYSRIWRNVLSSVGKTTYRPDITTPYYGAYILDAMAEIGHRTDALSWIREYWGGMIHEGATSFWEAYDPAWPKDDPHVDLQADDTAGYRISLAHGWSSGPTFWLMEQVLGIQPTGPGFSTVTLRPDLVDLDWAKGGEPTPNGMLNVDLKKAGQGLDATFDVPSGVEATVLFPVAPGTNHVSVNGKSETGTPEESGTRLAIVLKEAGKYEVRAK
ncbi:MAG TPA: alpha-L-rhamnosidase C-terminal domain-containing protein [Acidobacteriaceae bacterium]|nr:alpha-L-rhamnosidase C-terminal domain-containing protein [Acidobacteriaceae bacterium]